MNKIVKIILVIILVLILILAIHLIRNTIILNKIAKKQAENQNTNNYSLVKEGYLSNGDEIILDAKDIVYCKDGKQLRIIENSKVNFISWYDASSQEGIAIWTDMLKAKVYHEQPWLWGYNLELDQVKTDFIYILMSRISSKEVNGEKCYVVEWAGNEEYYNKENGNLVKRVEGETEIDGIKYGRITEYKEWKFGELTDEDVAKPDLSGYELIEN